MLLIVQCKWRSKVRVMQSWVWNIEWFVCKKVKQVKSSIGGDGLLLLVKEYKEKCLAEKTSQASVCK